MLRTLFATSALAIAAAAPLSAQDVERPTLSLSATAEVMIQPEFATVQSGVEITAPTAQAAMRENAELMSGVMSALRRAGVAERDLQTSNLSVQPVYEWINERSERRLTGYRARNIVTARVRELDEVGEVIDAMVGAGANNIESVTFGAEDTAEDMDEARRMAVARLLEKAELFASAAGLELCGVRSMSESSHSPTPMYANAMMAREMNDSATPVAAGELTLSATVSAGFCIQPAG